MARLESEIRVTPSVLDRLLDFEPKNTQEAPKSRSRSIQELKQSVRRDLEWLLNTRAYPDHVDEKLEEVQKSVVLYGLPDFTGISANNYAEQRRMLKAIETAIKYFEPRFLDVRIVLEPVNSVDKELRFHIEARLDMEPAPEPIVFDTVLQLGSGDIIVQEK